MEKPHQLFRKLEQPKASYPYDGLTGFWLHIPWWIHLSAALLIWPIMFWILPNISIKWSFIRTYLNEHPYFIATIITLFMVLSALLSFQRQRLQKATQSGEIYNKTAQAILKRANRESISQKRGRGDNISPKRPITTARTGKSASVTKKNQQASQKKSANRALLKQCNDRRNKQKQSTTAERKAQPKIDELSLEKQKDDREPVQLKLDL